MKTKWIILSLVIGGLFYLIGCMPKLDAIQFFGGLIMFPGIVGICDKVFAEKSAK